MSRVRSARTGGADEEVNDDYILEGEYEKLKRSHRHMQNDYNRYKEGCQRMLKKQNFLLGMLEGEKEAVETDLKNMSQAIVKKRDELNVETLRELCEEHIDSSKELAEEMQKLQDIESNLIDVEKQVTVGHSSMGNYYKRCAEHNHMQMEIGIFEDRVQQATVNLDTQLTLNRKLRDEIDHLRVERALYGDLYKRLSAELQHSKEELTVTIGTSTEAFEKRDEAHNKMATLKERREKDMQLHNSEMKELLRIISHDEKIKEFIRIKNNDRTEYKMEKAKRVQEEHERRGPAADRILLDTYEVAFNKIYDYTKEEDAHVVIDNFTQKEEENYALYNYANELSSETDELQAEVDSLRESIAKMSAAEQQLNAQWTDKMNTVESDLQVKSREFVENERQLHDVNELLDTLCEYIEELFEKLGCDDTPIKSQLGGEHGVSNITLYMAQIESRVMGLLDGTYYLNMQKSIMDLPLKLYVGTPKSTFKMVQPSVVPPSSFEEDAPDNDYETVTLMMEAELRAFVEKKLGSQSPKALSIDESVVTSTNVKKALKQMKKK